MYFFNDIEKYKGFCGFPQASIKKLADPSTENVASSAKITALLLGVASASAERILIINGSKIQSLNN